MSSPADHYKGFTDLASAQVEGTDYRVHVRANAGSAVAAIAPHGGSIEQYTSDVARDIAGANFNLYLFEGVRQAGNYAALHLTSHRFDEPRFLELLSRCNHVVAMHGWVLSPAYDLNPTPTDVKARILTTNIDLDEGTCSVGLLENAAEFFGLSLKQARATIREVADVTRTWQAVAQEVGCRRAEIARMTSAFEHDDLGAALRL